MHEYHWLPWEIDRLDNRTLMELVALHRLEAERAKRPPMKRAGKR